MGKLEITPLSTHEHSRTAIKAANKFLIAGDVSLLVTYLKNSEEWKYLNLDKLLVLKASVAKRRNKASPSHRWREVPTGVTSAGSSC